MPDTPPLYFCHGLPGCPRDASYFLNQPAVAPDLLAAMRMDMPLREALAVQFDALSDSQTPVHLVGFSIGAMAALEIAAARPARVAQVTLISAAAPLQLGDFLPEMAGRPVFQMAMRRGPGLRVMTAGQGLMLRLAPKALMKQLFSGVSALEQKQVAATGFDTMLKTGLRHAYQTNPQAYMRLLRQYVRDWTPTLAKAQAPVTLWHGEADGWAPMAMAEALVQQLRGGTTLYRVPEAGHYSTLSHACAALERGMRQAG